MNLVIFVHDFFTEVGHSRAMIELVRNLPPDKMKNIKEIKVVSFAAGNLSEYFPFPHLKLSFIRVPFPWLFPFLSRALFFQFFSFLYSIFCLKKDDLRIGIGTASLNVDIVNIQFIQKQYERLALNFSRHSPLKWIYKFFLFKYFSFCEDFLYHRKNLKFIVPAKFLATYLMQEFSVPEKNIQLTYSSVNTSEFNFNYNSKAELLEKLGHSYPVLKELKIHEPIYLFVGAFERKGLDIALEHLSKLKSSQFVIVGKSETKNRSLNIPPNVKTFFIAHTREIPRFYELADAFIFPTRYEPFGLVITEAFAMGLDIYVTDHEVGATELIKNQEAVYLLDTPSTGAFNCQSLSLSYEEKNKRRQSRIKLLNEYSWKSAAEKFATFLN